MINNIISDKSWQAIGPWGVGTINAIAVDPNDSNVIYIGVWGQGIYKSIDGGINWYSSSSGLTFLDVQVDSNTLEVTVIIIDPKDTKVIYIGCQLNGLYKSINSGKNWKRLFKPEVGNNTYYSISFASLVINPIDNKILYAATHSTNQGLVVKSNNAGINLEKQKDTNGNELGPTTLVQCNFQTVALSTLNPNIVYAGATKITSVFSTKDAGHTWLQSGLVEYDVPVLKCDLLDENTVYAGTLKGGFFKSENNGENWYDANNGLTNLDILDLASHHLSPKTLYAATTSGVYISFDSGENWSISGLTNTCVICLEIDPSNNNTLYAGTGVPITNLGMFFQNPGLPPNTKSNIGLLRSIDAGETWSTLINKKIPAHSQVLDMSIDPIDPNIIYIIVEDIHILVTYNAGKEWSDLLETSAPAIKIVVDPMNPDYLYVATEVKGIYKSNDRGRNWTRSQSGIENITINTVILDPKNSNTLYAGSNAFGVYKSIDAGINWIAISQVPMPIWKLYFDPYNSETMYILGPGKILVSNDHAMTWEEIPVFDDIHSFEIDPSDSSIMYAGSKAGILKSTDKGVNWKSVGTGFPDSNCIDLIVHPLSTSHLFASFGFGGIYESIDGGTNWNAIIDNQMTTSVSKLAIHPKKSNTIYAATKTSGVFKMQIKNQ